MISAISKLLESILSHLFYTFKNYVIVEHHGLDIDSLMTTNLAIYQECITSSVEAINTDLSKAFDSVCQLL